MKYVTYRTTGGMNTSQFATDLRDGEAPLLQNAEFREQRIWSMRKGYASIVEAVTGTPTILRVGNFIKANGIDYLIALDGTNLYRATSYSGSWTDEGDVAQSGTFDFDTFNNLFVIARSDGTMLKFDGADVGALGGSPPSDIRCVRSFRNFLFAGSGSTTTGSRLYFSALGNAESWNTGADYIDVNKDDGSWITGLAVMGDRLLIFKRHSIYQLIGYSSDTFEVIPLFMGRGCSNHQSIQEVEGSVIWADGDKRYRFSLEGLQEISWPVRTSFESFNQTFDGDSLFYAKKNQYWTTVDTGVGGAANAVMVYHLGEDRWTKLTGMAFSALGIATIDGTELPRKPIAGGYSNGLVYQLDYGTDDNGSDIAFEVDSGELDCGSPFVTKGFKDVWVWMSVDDLTIQPTLDYLVDGTSVETNKTLTPIVANHLYPVHLSLAGGGRAIQFKVKHTGKTGGQLHVGGFSIGFEPGGAFH